ncbi:hypothetical protein SO802_029158 [Lithocarpus litseifolius]|uniref:Transmembrane protein n=1 Tax=Lithocarpus litseifolius TaxID=425828 RepID=A0AAW2BVJ3_9ROSI
MGFSAWDSRSARRRGFLGVGFFAWLCWWWGSWVGVATVVVDVGGSGYGFVGVGVDVGGGGLLIRLWIVSIVPLFQFVG